MDKHMKILLISIIILVLCATLINNYYTDNIESSQNTLIITVCTGDMRALETGISVYAGYKQIPLILSDKTLPEQLEEYLPGYIKDNNITKIILVGPVSAEEIIKLQMMNVEVKQVKGDNIAEILTKIAENTQDKNNDTIIFTSSDPMAGLLGAYTKTPVFITAANSSYDSAEKLQPEYIQYLQNHKPGHIIIVGSLPETIITQLMEYDENIEIITGADSSQLSMNVIDKLKQEGYINNTTTAYYGFYGELPTIIPTVIKENAILIEDSTSHADTIEYLNENAIENVIITRNRQTDYIQMEETDYISDDVTQKLEENNISTEYLTRQRTLNEATGLYDTKIVTLEQNHNKTTTNNTNITKTVKSKPPLLSLLDKERWTDSNNITATVSNNSNGSITLKWSTIHPYTWTKNSPSNYIQKSDNGYEYHWTLQNNTWTVEYTYKNNTYYTVEWIENPDNTWTEKQLNTTFTWNFDGNTWTCLDKNNNTCYYITSN